MLLYILLFVKRFALKNRKLTPLLSLILFLFCLVLKSYNRERFTAPLDGWVFYKRLKTFLQRLMAQVQCRAFTSNVTQREWF